MEGDFEVTPPQFRSGLSVPKPTNMDFQLEEINSLISGSSFTALLELPPTQGMELLIKEDLPAKPMPPPIFPANFALASRLSIYASADNSLEKRTILSSSSSMKLDLVKQEPLELGSLPNSTSPTLSNQSFKSSKRKERQRKVKEQSKKSKKTVANEGSEVSGEKLPYVHVRARRGQATDSHSLAERARREKINARMKLLQELVPGCDKISGTAMVLDEIINHVQALQRQVEFLSMRLAAVNPRVDFDLVAFLAAENGSSIDTNYPDMFDYPIWLDGHINVNGQREYHHPLLATKEGTSNFITPDHSLLSYDPLVDFGYDRPNVK